MNKKTFKEGIQMNGVVCRGMWKLEENIEGVEEIIKHLLGNKNPFGKVKYFEKGRWKKIENFNYLEDIRSDDRNDLIFCGEGADGLLFQMKIKLEDIYIGKGDNRKLYSCNKLLTFGISNSKVPENLLNEYLSFVTKKFQITSGLGYGENINYSEDYIKKYISGKRYCETDIIGRVSFIGPFIFQDILNKEEFIKQITPLVYKLEETEEGGMYVQVNEHDAFNITTKENEHNYIEYLKVLNELLPYSAFQSLYYAKEIIDKYGGLKGWWRLISYIEKWGEEGMGDIKKLIPEVLNEEGKLNITDEDFKLLMGTPQANYQYLNSNTMQIEKKKFTKE